MGITVGVSSNRFEPYSILNREQAATMLTRVFKKVAIAGWTMATDDKFSLQFQMPQRFADDQFISSWAKDSVYFMVANNIIVGIGNNMFAPQNVTSAEEASGYANATREQALAIAVRMVDNLGDAVDEVGWRIIETAPPGGAASATPESCPGESMLYYVNSPNDGFLNLRDGPSLNSAVVCEILHGEIVEFLSPCFYKQGFRNTQSKFLCFQFRFFCIWSFIFEEEIDISTQNYIPLARKHMNMYSINYFIEYIKDMNTHALYYVDYIKF